METQELPHIWCVGVAVCAASYTFDRLFSYVSTREIPVGCRVVVPFGKGNAKRVGIVLSAAQEVQTEQQLKPVLSVVDKQPILSPEMLDMVSALITMQCAPSCLLECRCSWWRRSHLSRRSRRRL